jgi:hypothetical protein
VDRLTRGAFLLAALGLSPSCQTVRDPFPPQSALSIDITDSAVGTQRSAPPTPQIVSWTVEEANASGIVGFDGTYSFLRRSPCDYQLNVASLVSFSSACGSGGLTLAPGVDQKVTFNVRFSRIELRQAARPNLSSSADPDGDGIPNATDNCPIVSNSDQADVDLGAEVARVGDACSDLDSTGKPTIPDQDVDGVPDGFDNCLWFPSPLDPGGTVPPDTNANGIGDACERTAAVVLPAGGLSLVCKDVTFKTASSKNSFFRMDFGQAGVLSCDSTLTNCSLDASKIVLSLSGTATTFPCELAP